MSDTSGVAGAQPVVSVDLEIDGFEAFKQAFDEFNQAAQEMPQSWYDLDQVVVNLTDHMQELVDEAEALAEEVDDIGDGNNSGAGSSKRTRKRRKKKRKPLDAENWVNVFRPARSFAGDVRTTTTHLYQWTRVSKVFTALIGAGGLFGIDRLALGAADRRQAAMGAGVSMGQLSSFHVNYGRLGNTDAILGAFTRAQHDITARVPLYALGVGGATQGMDAAQAFAKTLPVIKKLVDKTDPRHLNNIVQAYHLEDLGIGLPQALELRNMSGEEVNSMIAGFNRDQRILDTPDSVARQWQDFTSQMERAADRVQIVIAKGLVGLAEPITHLSEGAIKLFDSIVADRNGPIKKWIDDAGDGLLWVAGKLGNGDFLHWVDDMLKHTDMSARGFMSLNEWISAHKTLLLSGGLAAAGLTAAGPLGAVFGAGLGVLATQGTAKERGEKQYDAGAAAEHPTLEQRNAERKGLGLPEYKTQEEYDKAEPAAKHTDAPTTSPNPAATPASPSTGTSDRAVYGDSIGQGLAGASGGFVPGRQHTSYTYEQVQGLIENDPLNLKNKQVVLSSGIENSDRFDEAALDKQIAALAKHGAKTDDIYVAGTARGTRFDKYNPQLEAWAKKRSVHFMGGFENNPQNPNHPLSYKELIGRVPKPHPTADLHQKQSRAVIIQDNTGGSTRIGFS